MIKRIWKWGIKTFFTRQFFIFAVIGILNTAIHFGIYFGMMMLFDETKLAILFSNTIAFIAATVFSYFANSKYTFLESKYSFKKFMLMMFVFLVKLLLSNLLTLGFIYVLAWLAHGNYYDKYATIPAQLVMIPLTFLVLDHLFKPSDEKKEEIDFN